MHTRQKKLMGALKRVQGYLDANDTRLGGVNATGTRQDLNTVVDQATALAAQQDPTRFTRQQELETQRAALTVVRDTWMRPIAKIAQLQLPNSPELAKLKLPPIGTDLESFLEAAHAMVAAASQYSAIFIKAGMPADFVAQFTAAIDAFETAIDNRQRAAGTRVGATAQLAATASKGSAVINVLDAFIRPHLANAADLKSDWERTKPIMARASAAATTPAAPTTTGSTASTPAPKPVVTPAPVTTPVATPVTTPAAPEVAPSKTS